MNGPNKNKHGLLYIFTGTLALSELGGSSLSQYHVYVAV